MTCHDCRDAKMVRFGLRRGIQRYRCKICKKTKFDLPVNPLVNLRIPFEKAVEVVGMLAEGVGIRAIERLAQLNRRTVLAILRVAAEKSASLIDDKIRNLKAAHVQADELVSFVGMKEFNAPQDAQDVGTFFTYLSIDRESKLIINCHTSKRTKEDTEAFLKSLKNRVQAPFQLTTDGWLGYAGRDGMVRRVFGSTIDYATEIKRYASSNPLFGTRYTRQRVVTLRKRTRIGTPDLKMATTCHCERTNLSMRIFTRRFTRYTLGYSKKLENLRHAVALFTAHFDFCRVHSAHGKTPAHAAGLTDRTWTVEDLLKF